MMTPELARRIAELRACDNVSDVHIVALDESGARALVRLIPRNCGRGSSDAYWQQPEAPILMMIDPAELLRDRSMH